jgi:hypothetical protein
MGQPRVRNIPPEMTNWGMNTAMQPPLVVRKETGLSPMICSTSRHSSRSAESTQSPNVSRERLAISVWGEGQPRRVAHQPRPYHHPPRNLSPHISQKP